MKKLVSIRMADTEDARGILDVYTPYILDSSVTFEYTVPSIGEFSERISNITKDMPYIVVSIDDEVAGYAYAAHYRGRAAYRWDCELSVYVREDSQRAGIGRMLYEMLFVILKEMNYVHAYACITTPNPQSIRFHEAMGFVKNALFEQCGYKFDRWYDVTWMDYRLMDAPLEQSYRIEPKPVRSVKDIPEDFIEKLFAEYENKLETSLQNDIMICKSFLGILGL